MSDVTVKRIEELDYYQGAKAIPGIRFRYAAKGLGITTPPPGSPRLQTSGQT